jgi:hypothetical protein
LGDLLASQEEPHFMQLVGCGCILLNIDCIKKIFQIKVVGARFNVFVAVKIQVKVFWVVTLYSVMVRYQRFRGPCCFHLQGKVHHGTLKC